MADEAVYRIVIDVDPRPGVDGGKRIKDSLDEVEHKALDVNQALELMKKGFEAIKTIIEMPIEQFRKLEDIASDLVKEYDRVYLSNIKLQVALKGVGDTSSETARRVEELAHRVADNSRFDDEAARDAAALAIQFGHQGDELDKVITIAADYATAFGGDLVNAVRKVEHGLQTGEIQFGRTSKTLSVLTDSAAKSAEVLEKLEARIGGVAKASIEGGAGSIIMATKAWDDFKEELGGALAKSTELQAFYDVSKEIFVNLASFVGANGEVISDVFGNVFIHSLDLAGHAAQLFFNIMKTGIREVLDLAARVATSPLAGHFGIPTLGPEGSAYLAEKERQAQIVKEINDRSAAFQHGVEMGSDPKGLNDAILDLGRQLEASKKKSDDLRDSLLGLGGVHDDIVALIADFDELEKQIGKSNLPKSFDEAFERIKARALELDKDRRTRDAAGPVDDNFQSPSIAAGYVSQIETQKDQEILKTQQAIRYQEIYQQHLEDIDHAAKTYGFTEKQIHDLRIQYAQQDLAAAKDWQSGLELAFANTEDGARNDAKTIQSVWTTATSTIADGLAQLATSGKANWKDLADSAIAQINRIIAEQLVLKAVAGIGGAFFGGGGGTNLDGSPSVGGNGTAYTPPARAEGGPVIGGRAYLVGEKGKTEVFRPSQSGTVTPVDKLAAPSFHVSVVNVSDPDEITRHIASGKADREILNVMARNRSSSRGLF